MLNYHRFMGFYYTPYWMALLGMRGLVHGPSKTNQRKSSHSNATGRTKVRALRSDSAVALGSRSTGLGGMVL